MRHRATPRFWARYAELPEDVREQADRGYALLKADARHPSLHFKRIGRYWSVRVGIGYRAVGVADKEGPVWFWIGTHAAYDRLVGGA